MRSLLTSVQSIRVLVEKSEVYTLERVLELFLPLLDIIAGHYDCSVEQILVDALSSHVLREQSEIHADFDQGIRKDLEMRAEPHCSAGGMIDTLPTAVISHALSFLTLEDRFPVELTCRSLLTISRNTPAICADFNVNDDEECARQLFSHKLVPMILRTTMELENTGIQDISIDQVRKLSVDVTGNPEWYPTHDYPKLTTLDVKCAVRDAAKDSWALWKFVDDYRISRIAFRFSDSRHFWGPAHMMHQITKRKFITNLSIDDPSTLGFSHASNSLDLSQLSVVHYRGSGSALMSFMQPTLKELVLDLDDISDYFISRYIDDDSFLLLPNIELLSIKNESVLSLIESKGHAWTSLKNLDIEMGFVPFSEFLELLEACTNIPFLRHLNIIAEGMKFNDADLTDETDDSWGSIWKMPNLTELKVGFHECYASEKLYHFASALQRIDDENAEFNVTFGFPLKSTKNEYFKQDYDWRYRMVSVDEITPSHPF